MFKFKAIAVSLFAVIAFSAVVAGSASAEWRVNGTALGAGSKEPLLTLAVVHEPAVLNVPSLKIKLTCKGNMLNGTNPEIIGTSTGAASSLTFEDCTTTEPATECVLEPILQNISTNPITATAALAPVAPADRVTFSPKTKSIFTQVEFNAENKCAFTGLEPITGKVTINAPSGQSEVSLQPIEGLGSVENNSLEIAGAKAFIEKGKALVAVTKMQPWSFR